MHLRPLLIAILLISGCARFEPRVSVETQEAPGARRGQSVAVAKPATLPADYTVTRGDTLYGIAFRNKLDFRDLAAWNNINAPYTIYPGQGLRLKPPSRTRRVTDLPPAATPTAPTVAVQQVEVAAVPIQTVHTPAVAASDSGDTQTFAVADDAAPAAVATPPAVARPLQPLPATSPPAIDATTAVATTSPAAAIGLPAQAPQPQLPATAPAQTVATPDANAVVAVDTTPRAVVDANAPTRTRDGLRWRWPVNGRVVGRFVEGDPTQQGIDIAGNLGQVVLAAAEGDVVYSGNGLLGYGELVIVQHSPGYLSAYGHNQKRLVVEGARIKAGQPIAEMGRRGGIDMLHFEIRRNGKPVDPLGYLPNR